MCNARKAVASIRMIVRDLLQKSEEELVRMLEEIDNEPIDWTPVILSVLTLKTVQSLLEAAIKLQSSSNKIEALTKWLIGLTLILGLLAAPPAYEILAHLIKQARSSKPVSHQSHAVTLPTPIWNDHALVVTPRYRSRYLSPDTRIDSASLLSGNWPFGRGMKQLEMFVPWNPTYHSCFMSYSSGDDIFVQRLYHDLLERGVQCWLAAEDMKTGTKVRPSLDEAISTHDKLLLVLSQKSVQSQWVEQEVETALSRERREDCLILLPIRIDDAVFSSDAGWAAFVKNSRHIGDFTRWQDKTAYQKALIRLLRDLKTAE
jgi:hypothetical protein